MRVGGGGSGFPDGRSALLAVTLSACLGLGCATSPRHSPGPEGLAELLGELRVAAVAVEEGGELGLAERRSLAEYEVLGVLRQSTLDWLEQRRRFSRQGELRVGIRVEALYLRGPLVARWWPGLGARDRLAVQVTLRRGDVELKRFESFVESRVGGRDWADSGARARRLARRLGQRVAEAF